MNSIYDSKENDFLKWKINGFSGAPAVLLDQTESTHAYAKEHLGELIAGTLIVANAQNSGRGRHHRSWISPSGKNLYFNLLIPFENFSSIQYSQITQITAITLSRFFNELGAGTTVKWPNDILWNGKKLGGIIAELFPTKKQSILSIGIGLNINTTQQDLEIIDRPATSLFCILGKKINRELLLREIILRIEKSVHLFIKEGFSPWLESWKKMEAFFGYPGKIIQGEEVIRGTVTDINADGSLRFQTETGSILSVYSGDLEI